MPRGTGELGFYETESERVPIASLRFATPDDPAWQALRTDTATFETLVQSRRHRGEEWFADPVDAIALAVRRPFARCRTNVIARSAATWRPRNDTDSASRNQIATPSGLATTPSSRGAQRRRHREERSDVAISHRHRLCQSVRDCRGGFAASQRRIATSAGLATTIHICDVISPSFFVKSGFSR
ncbi:MAG: hypothetical protein U5K38_02590 [Woeseiaceae bacterium]|nr:hypothetical protein [Woeseiaceae bacterium]